MPNAPGMTLSLHVRESKTVLDSGFQAVDSGSSDWILDSLRIKLHSDSKAQQSRYHIQKFHGFQNPDSLTWGRF